MEPMILNFNFNDVLVLLPELFLLASVCVILLLDLFLKPEQRNITHWLSVLALVITGALLWRDAPATGQVDVAFSNMFVRDGVATILKLFALLVTALTLVFGRSYMRERQLLMGEYYVLMLFATIGALVLISAGSLVTVYLGLELMSLCTFALVALNRDSSLSSEAAIKYFVLSALSSGLLLYGMSMTYGATGTLDLAQINALATFASGTAHPNLLAFGLVFMLVGITFKLGAAPFHMWLPDVYEGAPTTITTFISATMKLAAVAMAYRLLVNGLSGLSADWTTMLGMIAALTLAVGNLFAIVQTNLKRMLAYSTISHIGFMLLGFVAGTPQGMAAAMFYMICYALMATAAFGMIMLLSRAGFEADEIDDFKGLNQRSPWYAGIMALAMFSLAGIPPMFGFFAKLLVLKAVIDAGQLWLAIVAIVFAIIGLIYYLRVVKVMYFDPPADPSPLTLPADLPLRWTLSLNGLALLALGLGWSPLINWCISAVAG